MKKETHAAFPTSLIPTKRPFRIDDLKVETDVPFSPRNCPTGKWQPMLDLMTKPGQSIAFPVEFKAAVTAFALKRKKEGSHKVFRVAKVSDTQARIWFISAGNRETERSAA